jgi:hypothetical protein
MGSRQPTTTNRRHTMSETSKSTPGHQATTAADFTQTPLFSPVFAGILSWIAISLGFYGLKMLMHERPEFVGPPMRATQTELVQESPQIVIRKSSDDISVIKPAQPETSDVMFTMIGRRDYRGLQTTLDMSGEFRAKYILTNSFAEPQFVLFKCPHPRAEQSENQSVLAGDLKLQASLPGHQESTKEAWFWSGTIAPHGVAEVEVSYHVTALKGVTYRVSDTQGSQVKKLRVHIQRKDIPAMRFESGDGVKLTTDETVTWERRDFLTPDQFSARIVESRNLFVSLSQLLQIGPLISLLFLATVTAIVLARQPMTAIQMFTIAAGYALYFPLILYLSARFSFTWALVIAFIVPGILLVNYSRWLIGGRFGLIGAAVLLALFQLFPTLAAFAGWNRGLLLICLGVITLAVLINLQNQALRRDAIRAAALALLLLPVHGSAGEVQVLLPAELVSRISEPRRETTNTVATFGPVPYRVRQETNFFHVEASVPVQVLRVGETTVPMFSVPVHLQKTKLDPADSGIAELIITTNRLELFALRTGAATLELAYRVPIVNHEGKKRAHIPLVLGPSGTVLLESARNDLAVLTGNLWAKAAREKSTQYDIGVAGLDALVLELPDQSGVSAPTKSNQTEAGNEFYGIGITRAQHLTVINSDGSCTHFAEFELPAPPNNEFRMGLPIKARLISVSVNGSEINSPEVSEQVCRVRLPNREGLQNSHRLSFRVAYPALPLGFVGSADLALPEVFQTTATLEWVVALPTGFSAQVVSSGLERQKTGPDLSRFGDYGRILKSHALVSLAKELAPPGLVGLTMKYRQTVPGMYEAKAD